MKNQTQPDYSCGLTARDFSPVEESQIDLCIHVTGFSATMLMLLSLAILGAYSSDQPIAVYVAASFLFVVIEMVMVKSFSARVKVYRCDTTTVSARKKKQFLEQIYALHKLPTGTPSRMIQYYMSRISLFEKGLFGALMCSIPAGLGAVFILLVALLFGDGTLVKHSEIALLLTVNTFKMSVLGVMSSCLMRFRGMVFSRQ